MNCTEILIVEDSKTFNNTIASLLKSNGYIVTQSYTLSQAREIVESQKFDFILLDLMLPDGEGDDLIEGIKEKSDAKIIVLSGAQDIQRRNYLFEQKGVIDYFSKDVPLKLLIHDIDNLIQTVQRNINSTILVVDDSSFVRKTIKLALESKNYKVLVANDPIEAYEVLRNNPIDLIFSDLEMPHMSGVEFTEKIKNKEEYKDIPILILSSSDNRQDYARVLKHGAVDFIKKPFILEEIILKCDLHIKHSHFVKQIATQTKDLQEYKRVLDESDIVSKTDKNGKITYVNNKFLEISGYEEKDLIGKSHKIVRHPDVPKEIFKEMWDTIKNKKTFRGVIKNKRKDDTSYYVDATVVPILDIHGEIKEYIGLRHDITDIMDQKRQFIDDIKHISNPIVVLGKIKNNLLLNDFYGESFINKVEDYLTLRLHNLMPLEINVDKVYPLGYGEFGFILNSEVSSLSNIEISLKKFQNNIKSYDFILDDNKIDIEFDFTFTSEKDKAFENLKVGIRKAQKEKMRIVFANGLSEIKQEKAQTNIKMVHLLKNAIENKNNSKIISYYQPVMNNKTNEIEKYESLVRLQKEDGTLISPYFFLDVSKKAGYYHAISNIVIENIQYALAHTDKDITLNLSTIDIEDLDTRNVLLELITKSENKGRIVFELLEDETAQDFDTVKDFISLAKVLGDVKVAIDDFGSGYSNFERLLDFQPDILKIDGSLVKNIVTDPFSKHVVEAIVLFAKKENIQTVAEFIADEDIFNEVKSLDIDYSQGFFIGKPDVLKS